MNAKNIMDNIHICAILAIALMIGLLIGAAFLGCFLLVSIGIGTWNPQFDSITTRLLLLYAGISYISLFYIYYKYKQEKKRYADCYDERT